MNSLLFSADRIGSHDPDTIHLMYSAGDIRRLDPAKDRLLLMNLARNASGIRQQAALRKLGLTAVPAVDPAYRSDDLFDEAYWLIDEQVLRVDDPALLVRAAFEGFGEKRYFAFCRLTGYRYPAPDCDALSHRTYACPRFPGYTDDDVRAFCREMIARNGLFSREAKECLESLPETDET